MVMPAGNRTQRGRRGDSLGAKLGYLFVFKYVMGRHGFSRNMMNQEPTYPTRVSIHGQNLLTRSHGSRLPLSLSNKHTGA